MEIVDVKQHLNLDGKRIYAWKTFRASEARRLADPRLRCPECFGAIGLFASSVNKRMPERGEHRQRNPGCTLGDCYDGEPKRIHKFPIEPDQKSVNAGVYEN